MPFDEPVDASALFVYYRVPRPQQTTAFLALSDMQARLGAAWPGLRARLMRRTDRAEGGDAEATWMEVYEHPQGLGPDFLARLQFAVDALPAELIGPRHTESFAEVSPSQGAPD
jgi:hypothetical protein